MPTIRPPAVAGTSYFGHLNHGVDPGGNSIGAPTRPVVQGVRGSAPFGKVELALEVFRA